jgi:hypothetical protein
MKASELRIGNYYMFADYNGIVTRKVREIKTNEFGLTGDYDGTNFEICKPIELTEHLLLQFGFETDNIEWWNGILSIGIYKDGLFYCPTDEISFRAGRKITYVHQLQNLYFALTGEELTINN